MYVSLYALRYAMKHEWWIHKRKKIHNEKNIVPGFALQTAVVTRGETRWRERAGIQEKEAFTFSMKNVVKKKAKKVCSVFVLCSCLQAF